MATLFLKPNPHRTVEGNPLKVFDPERKAYLPADGANVPNSPYWVRRVAAGDCVYADRQPAAAPAPAPAAAPKEPADKKNTLTKKELQAFLTALGIEYPKNATASQLADLVEEITAKKSAEKPDTTEKGE